jgi:NADPH-dependent 2,4-dienoyl-CoA reductase/sulfur reductase-like enzyme
MSSALEPRDVVVIGGGPAGMAAAIEARRSGASVSLIDERPSLGGQIYKQPPAEFTIREPGRMGKEYRAAQPLIRAAFESGAEILTQHVAWSVWPGPFGEPIEVAVYAPGARGRRLAARRLIVAAGAYDRAVPFPGWTLPGVLTAGGAQALMKIHKVLPGRRILLAGSGPLALAFSAQLHQLGANVVAVLEAAPFPSPRLAVGLVGAGLRGNLGLLREGLGYLLYLRRSGVPVLYGHAIARAEGRNEVERAVAVRVDRSWRPVPGAERVVDVDTICVGYGFFPSIEIARSLGCALEYDEQLGGHVPLRDHDLQSSVSGVYLVGDGAGVAGSATALAEGQIAGAAAARDLGLLSGFEATVRMARPRRRLAALRRFRGALDAAYAVGPGIYEWATDETVVCRCEEVSAGEVRAQVMAGSRDPNVAKALTRVSMGLCQGRTCGRQVAWIVGRATGQPTTALPPLSARPPVKPVPIGAIADMGARLPAESLRLAED